MVCQLCPSFFFRHMKVLVNCKAPHAIQYLYQEQGALGIPCNSKLLVSLIPEAPLSPHASNMGIS